jgi:hypothetical protein
MNVNKLRQENESVKQFIKQFQEANEYNKPKITEYNSKFKIEFNSFLDNGNFSQSTINLFKL